MVGPAVEQMFGDVGYTVSDVKFIKVLYLDLHDVPQVRLSLKSSDEDDSAAKGWDVTIESTRDGEHDWTLHATMHVQLEKQMPAAPINIEEMIAQTGKGIECGETFYETLGNAYGGDFRSLQTVWEIENGLIGRVELKSSSSTTKTPAFLLISALLDVCTHVGMVPLTLQQRKLSRYVSGAKSFHIAGAYRKPLPTVWCHVEMQSSGQVTKVSVYDAGGKILAEMAGLEFALLKSLDSIHGTPLHMTLSNQFPLLETGFSMPDESQTFFAPINDTLFQLFADHCVNGEVTLPGAAFIEMALEVGAKTSPSGQVTIRDISIMRPLSIGSNRQPTTLMAVLHTSGELEISTELPGGKQVHMTATVVPISDRLQSIDTPVGLASIQAELEEHPKEAVEAMYFDHALLGLQYFSRFQTVHQVWSKGSQVLARVKAEQDGFGFLCHPAALDGCFQVSTFGVPVLEDLQLRVPYSVDTIQLFQTQKQTEFWVLCTVSESQGVQTRADFTLFGNDGCVFLQIDGFCTRTVHPGQWSVKPVPQMSYEVEWVTAAIYPSEGPVAKSVLFFNADSDLRERLQKKGHKHFACDSQQLGATLQDHELSAVVFLGGLLTTSEEQVLAEAMELIIEMAAKIRPLPIFLLTQYTQAISDVMVVDSAPQNAGLWGMARTARLEYPELVIQCLDLHAHSSLLDTVISQCLECSWCLEEEEEVVFQVHESGPPKALVPRLVRGQMEQQQAAQLALAIRGNAVHAHMSPQRKHPVKPNELEIRVHAAAIDASLAIGPLHPTFVVAGVVVDAGQNLQQFCVGQLVSAMMQGALGTYTTVSAESVLPIPQEYSFQQAACMRISGVVPGVVGVDETGFANVASGHIKVFCGLHSAADALRYMHSSPRGNTKAVILFQGPAPSVYCGGHRLPQYAFRPQLRAEDIHLWALGYQNLQHVCEGFIAHALHSTRGQEVVERHRRMYTYWQHRWGQAITNAVGSVDVQALEAELEEVGPAEELVRRCGPHLSGVVRGTVDPFKLLFDSFELTTAFYEQSGIARVGNERLASAVLDVVNQFPPGQVVKILEIGAGTGASTSSLLPNLNPFKTRYVFTDVSKYFLHKGLQRFKQYGFVEYCLFDAEEDPCLQGIRTQQFDIVVAVNVLHATRDMAVTMRNVHSLLRPGGHVVIRELTEFSPLVAVTFALTEGWWRFTDTERRHDGPLLSVDSWSELLVDTGFANINITSNPVMSSECLCTAVKPGNELCNRASLISQDATYLISGGLGGLGLLTARLLVEHGAKNVVLLSRTNQLKDSSNADWMWLDSSDCNVHRFECDISTSHDVTRLRQFLSNQPPLRGIIHSAGVLSDATMSNLDSKNIEAVYRPKVHGAWALHCLAEELGATLDLFWMYSSASALFGSMGQANYAAANACLDALAHWRQSCRLPALCIQWGALSDIGIAARTHTDEKSHHLGFGRITRASAFEALESALWSSCAQVAVVPVDWERFQSGGHKTSLKKFLSAFQGSAMPRSDTLSARTPISKVVGGNDHPNWVKQLHTKDQQQRHTEIRTKIMAAVVAAGVEEMEGTTSWGDAGLDSLAMVEVRNALNRKLGDAVQLKASVWFEYPTLDTLVDHIDATLLSVQEPVLSQTPDPATVSSQTLRCPPSEPSLLLSISDPEFSEAQKSFMSLGFSSKLFRASNGAIIEVYDNNSTGQLLVAFPGWGLDVSSVSFLVDVAREKSYHMLVIPTPGSGRTEYIHRECSDVEFHRSFGVEVAKLLPILGSSSEPLSLFGFSYGACTAVTTALQCQLNGRPPQSLMLSHYAFQPLTFKAMKVSMEEFVMFEGFDGSSCSATSKCRDDVVYPPPPTLAGSAMMNRLCAPDSTESMPFYISTLTALAKETRVLLLGSSSDPWLVPEVASSVTGPNVMAHVIRGGNHWDCFNQPLTMRVLVGLFLDQVQVQLSKPGNVLGHCIALEKWAAERSCHFVGLQKEENPILFDQLADEGYMTSEIGNRIRRTWIQGFRNGKAIAGRFVEEDAINGVITIRIGDKIDCVGIQCH
jgi:SAM-dependent methyltransferase/NADP-dependent 3-hydroxy acid dehydrogenase YdfG